MSTTPSDWDHWAGTLGLREYLLPVVSDMSVPLMPAGVDGKRRTSLTESNRNKVPSRITRLEGEDYVVGVPGWQLHTAAERDIARWSCDSRLGICVQARAVRALDIDIEDASAARRVVAFVYEWLAHEQLPPPDVRGRQGVGKCLMPFRVEGGMSKRRWDTPYGIIEWLADGQQWLARRDAGAVTDYVWADASGAPVRNPTTLGVLSPEQFERLWAALGAAFGVGLEQRDSGSGELVARERVDAAAVEADPVVRRLRAVAEVHGVDSVGRVAFRCPFEHSSGDYAEGGTVYLPAGTGGRSAGHYKCLHSSCAGRSDAEFEDALGLTADGFDVVVPEPGAPAERPAGLTLQPRTGRIEPDLVGLVAALRHPEWSGVCVMRDAFDGKTRVRFGFLPAPAQWSAGWLDGFEEFHDSHVPGIILALVACGFVEPGKDRVWMTVQHMEREATIDSAQSWLRSLQWDGVPRIARFFSDYWHCGGDPAPYIQAASRYFWLGLAGRVMYPGIKADMLVVVKGEQGCGKSRGAAATAPPDLYGTMTFSERTLADSVLYTNGRVLLEFAELAGLSKRESEAVKDFLSAGTDTYRMRFERRARDYPRRAMFLGTTNEDQYLSDPTGHRRWLPLSVDEGAFVDVDAIERDRDQLWAEAAAALAADRRALEHAAKAAETAGVKHEVHDDRVVREASFDSAVEIVLARLSEDFGPESAERGWRIYDVLIGLGYTPDRFRRADEMRVAAVLRRMGYVKVRTLIDGVRSVRWVLA